MIERPVAKLAEGRDIYHTTFKQMQRDLSLPAFASDLRERAFARFNDLGFPTTKHERWRFTNVAPIVGKPFVLAPQVKVTAALLAPYQLASVTGPRLVFVNGRYAAEHSAINDLPVGLEMRSLAETLAIDAGVLEPRLGKVAAFDNEVFTALNTALLHDGAVVRVAANTVVESPVHLLFVSTGSDSDAATAMSHPRVLVEAGENSQIRIIESYAGANNASYFLNGVTEVVAGPNAVVDHYKLLRDSMLAFHIASMQLQLARSANFSSHSITLGGALVRNDVDVLLNGEGIECTLNGLYLANNQRLVDNHTTIHHAKPNCASHEFYKGIIDDHAHAVFNGKIIVEIDAQKTNAKQTNKALLLSEDAQINTKPELEIFANDVKCTHGATVGQLDEKALFYLRSRGLGNDQARSVLIHAFASDLLNQIAIDPLRVKLEALLLQQLPGASGRTFHG